jgi:lipopolysaccharide/colanic/teichoic acid biosynthesis glycosyltransferase
VLAKLQNESREAPLELLPAVDPPAWARYVKRIVDLAGAGLALILLSPLWILIAIAVRLDSPGPVVYSAQRVGRGGRRICLFKFRTMFDGAHMHQDDVIHLNGAGEGTFKVRSDPRVTRLGRFLRSTYLDELPQLLNVIVGQMSLVGPRPLSDWEEALLGNSQERLRFLPGMTGNWQVSGEWAASLQRRAALDEAYQRNWSLRLDLVILLKTVTHVVARRGV